MKKDEKRECNVISLLLNFYKNIVDIILQTRDS